MSIHLSKYKGVLAASVLMLVAVCWYRLSSSVSERRGAENETAVPQGKHRSPETGNQAQADEKKLRGALKAAFEQMERNGIVRKMPPVRQFLKEAVASGDKGKILRAFQDAIYARYWRLSQVLPVLKEFLGDANPFARFNAARDLFTVGEKGGYGALLALVEANNGIEGIGEDLRISAAQVLAQYGETDATNAIFSLYERTERGELIEALLRLAPEMAGTLVPPKGYYDDPSAIRDYGLENERQYLTQIVGTFRNSKNPDAKIAAAWSLATMTGDENAIAYLVQAAQLALHGQSEVNNSREIIKDLGSIQSTEVRPVLEEALSSTDPMVVQTAIANLIFNQGGSERAVQVIADQLSDTAHAKLPWDFTLNMATQLIDQPQIQAAGAIFAQYDSAGDWQLYTVERKNWPIANWIGDYVVKLKK